MMQATREHGSIGENVKVHFAGMEQMDFAKIVSSAGVNYFLFTVLKYIKDRFAPQWGTFSCCKSLLAYEELPKMGKHVIMDSGLFTLMFGACKDIRPDEKYIRSYKDAICEFVIEKKLDPSIACVECDCQKLLGTEIAWQLRTQMRQQIPNPIINVFHFEDGRYGLDRMIEFSDYIAISVPELRIVKPKTYKEDTYRLASYIKDRKPQIDLHLLGCTEVALLQKCKFATSADSTSWQQVNRYGRICGYHIKQIKQDEYERKKDDIRKILIDLDVEPTETRLRYQYNFWLSATLLKQKYTRYAGNQD